MLEEVYMAWENCGDINFENTRLAAGKESADGNIVLFAQKSIENNTGIFGTNQIYYVIIRKVKDQGTGNWSDWNELPRAVNPGRGPADPNTGKPYSFETGSPILIGRGLNDVLEVFAVANGPDGQSSFIWQSEKRDNGSWDWLIIDAAMGLNDYSAANNGGLILFDLFSNVNFNEFRQRKEGGIIKWPDSPDDTMKGPDGVNLTSIKLIADKDNLLEIFALNKSLWHRKQNQDNSWADWESFKHPDLPPPNSSGTGAGVGRAPQAAPTSSAFSNGLKWIARKIASAVAKIGAAIRAFFTFVPIGEFTSNQVVVLGENSMINFFCIADDNNVYTKHQKTVADGGGWSDWESLGSPGKGQMLAAAINPTMNHRLIVLYSLGKNGEVARKKQVIKGQGGTGQLSWGDWESLPLPDGAQSIEDIKISWIETLQTDTGTDAFIVDTNNMTIWHWSD